MSRMYKSVNVGETNGSAKLTNQQVLELRKEYADCPFNIPARAKKLGVSKGTLSKDLKGEKFKSLPDSVKLLRMHPGSIDPNLIDSLRKEYRIRRFNIKKKAKDLGLKYISLLIAITEESSRYKEPALGRINRKTNLGDYIVALREEYAIKPFALAPRATLLSINVGSLSKALRGLTFKHLPGAVEIKPVGEDGSGR